jgi:hypothetical protein
MLLTQAMMDASGNTSPQGPRRAPRHAPTRRTRNQHDPRYDFAAIADLGGCFA